MTFKEILNFAKEYPAILSLATFFVGLYLGNKQAIGRDRRKEFNEISEDAFIALNKQIEQLKAGFPDQRVSDFSLFTTTFLFTNAGSFADILKDTKKHNKT